MPKDTSKDKQRHEPLYADLTNGHGSLRAKPRAKEGRKRDEKDNSFVDAKLSRKILNLAKEQQEEIEQEEDQRQSYRLDDLQDSEVWIDESEEEYDDDEEFQEIQEIEIPQEDADLFDRYVGDEPFGGTGNMTLADKIMSKVKEKEMGEPSMDQDDEPQGVMLPPKVIETYTKVGELLANYRSGKLPKVFKMATTLKNWQDVLYVMQPESWSPQAVYEATRLYVSNLPGDKSKIFIEQVLLERFREDIQNNNNVNVHVYRALKKSLYKPAAFFKGFLFPLCESGTCTKKEAVIVGSILSKVSIPILHSAVALLKLCEMDYSGANSYFIQVLVNKKYALPYRVVDACVFHFMQFRQETKKALPVIWQQSLLAFAQRYKNDITLEQRDGLLDVVKMQFHDKISPEIRRELTSGQPRGEMMV